MELRVFQWGDGEYPTHWLIGDFEAGVVVCTLIDKDLAYVMAVAPEMLEALEGAKWLIESYVSDLANNEEYQDVCEAIKKARGEE